MKLLLGIVIAILMTIAVSERPSVALDPMNWSATSYLYDLVYQFATSKDLLVYSEYSNLQVKRGSSFPMLNIRRRNDEGVYVPVGSFSEYPAFFASTNGKWVLAFSKGLVLFKIDSDNVISDSSFIGASGGYLLSDDTFVGYDPISETQDRNYTIRTYQHESSNNTWINIPGTELIVTTSVSSFGDSSSYRATDTHLVIADLTNTNDIYVKIYERQANKSWKFIESVPVNRSFVDEYDFSVNYNGVDTFTFAYTGANTGGNGTGILFVYTKSNDKWTEQTFTTLSVGYRPQGLFGTVTTFVDTNTLLVTAALEGYISARDGDPKNAGKVLVMTRNANGAWEPSFDLAHPSGEGLFGLALGVNDYDVIVPNFIIPTTGPNALTLTFYSTPRCTFQPINVTCNDQQVNDCSQLNVSSLYTINTQCGDITATLNGLSLVNNKALQAQFSFTKSGGKISTCSATVTCPVPPVVVQPPSSSVSVASALEFGLASLFLAVAMFM